MKKRIIELVYQDMLESGDYKGAVLAEILRRNQMQWETHMYVKGIVVGSMVTYFLLTSVANKIEEKRLERESKGEANNGI